MLGGHAHPQSEVMPIWICVFFAGTPFGHGLKGDQAEHRSHFGAFDGKPRGNQVSMMTVTH